MLLNISHVFYKERLIAEKSQLSLNFQQKQLLLIDHDKRENIYSPEKVHSLEWCWHETGPLFSSKFEAFAVLQFASSQPIFDHQIDPFEPVVLVLSNALANFVSVQLMVIKYQRVFTANVVKLLPFTQFPDIVKRVLPKVAYVPTRTLKEHTQEKEEIKKVHPVSSDDTNCIQIDEEDGSEPPVPYYDIGGGKMQITTRGISSLADGEYMNDEAINAAFSNIQKEFPYAYVFDTLTTGKILDVFGEKTMGDNCKMSEDEFNRHFGLMFLKKSSYESRPINETFFAKKMLIFPMNHINHWYLVVVVNPLLCDITKHMASEKEDQQAAAYYVDSLMGTAKYPDELMLVRLNHTWNGIFSFLHLGAIHHLYTILSPKLISCYFESNIPSQDNAFDCGPHTIINARLMGTKFDELTKGHDFVAISYEECEQVKEDVANFRRSFRETLERCKINPS